MVLDIIVLAIIVAAMVLGFRRGFIRSFVHTLGWIAAIAAGFFFATPLKEQLVTRTMLDENLHMKITEKLTSSFDAAATSADSLPLILGKAIDTATAEAAMVLADRLTGLILIILCYLALVIVVKLLFFIIIRLFSKKNNDGFVGFFDGLLGMIAGSIRGILLVFLLLMLLVPAVNLMSPENMEMVMVMLDESNFASTLYDANFLVLIIENCI